MATTFKYNAEYWSEEVKRFIFARLDSIWANESGSNDKLMNFIKSLLHSSGDDLKWIATLYHINKTDGALEYVLNIVPEFLNTLAWRSEDFTINSNRITGKVLWNRTYVQRLSTGNTTAFVLKDSKKSINTDENQLLIFYLNELANINIPVNWKSSRTTNRVGDNIVQLIEASKQILQSTYLREVSSVSNVSSRMILLASRHKSPLYSKLAELCFEYEKIFNTPDLETLKELLSQGWIQPKLEESTDDLFELFVLLSTLNTLESVLLEVSEEPRIEYNLIRPGGSYIVARLQNTRYDVQVTFDRSPKNLFGASEVTSIYKNILELYDGVNGNARRPDILLKIVEKTNSKETRLLIEVKNTDAESTYASDSVYKALGYLKDYESFWQTTQQPKIVLAYPYGINVRNESNSNWMTQDIMLISGDLKSKITNIIKKFIN